MRPSNRIAAWVHGVSVVAVLQSSRQMDLAQDPSGHAIANSDVLGFNAPGRVPLPIGGITWNGGAGKVFRSKGAATNAFHCPIPTPAVCTTGRPVFSQAMLLYSCTSGVKVELIRLYDGPNQLGNDLVPQTAPSFDGSARELDLVANYTLFPAAAFDLDRDTSLLWGLDLLVVVSFRERGDQITFTAAGAEFVVPDLRGDVA